MPLLRCQQEDVQEDRRLISPSSSAVAAHAPVAHPGGGFAVAACLSPRHSVGLSHSLRYCHSGRSEPHQRNLEGSGMKRLGLFLQLVVMLAPGMVQADILRCTDKGGNLFFSNMAQCPDGFVLLKTEYEAPPSVREQSANQAAFESQQFWERRDELEAAQKKQAETLAETERQKQKEQAEVDAAAAGVRLQEQAIYLQREAIAAEDRK